MAAADPGGPLGAGGWPARRVVGVGGLPAPRRGCRGARRPPRAGEATWTPQTAASGVLLRAAQDALAKDDALGRAA